VRENDIGHPHAAARHRHEIALGIQQIAGRQHDGARAAEFGGDIA
jgi:hypothetical protein